MNDANTRCELNGKTYRLVPENDSQTCEGCVADDDENPSSFCWKLGACSRIDNAPFNGIWVEDLGQ